MQPEADYQSYKLLLDLWKSENYIKTIKLQFLLLTNVLLIAATAIAGGRWFVYAGGVLVNVVWLFSIGRTALFQDVWQAKLAELQARYPNDARFSLLLTEAQQKRVRASVRLFGVLPSRWYLLYSPLGFALVWLAALVAAR